MKSYQCFVAGQEVKKTVRKQMLPLVELKKKIELYPVKYEPRMSGFLNIYNTDETKDKLLHKHTAEICLEKWELANLVFFKFDLTKLS